MANTKANTNHTHNTSDIKGLSIPTKVSDLTNDSNYQTAKQVNSAVTTEIAKVETKLKLINLGGNVDANNCRIAEGTNGVYGYCGLFTQNVPKKDYAVIRCYQYGSGIRQFIDYTSQFNTKTYTRFIQYDGKIPTDWKELATMDKVDYGYVKIIKNNDTDTNEAMLISYKNRDLFGVRLYKDDNSEHELRFSASGISYVKDGVTVWTK